MEPVLIIGAS